VIYLGIVLKISQCVIGQLALVQKTVQLITGINSEQRAKLIAGKSLLEVCIEGNRFKGGAGEVAVGVRGTGTPACEFVALARATAMLLFTARSGCVTKLGRA
jgi:hypothetical protein